MCIRDSQEVEDIYAPYKQKKRTRATIAKERGLEQLALDILNKNISNIDEEASKYIKMCIRDRYNNYNLRQV